MRYRESVFMAFFVISITAHADLNTSVISFSIPSIPVGIDTAVEVTFKNTGSNQISQGSMQLCSTRPNMNTNWSIDPCVSLPFSPNPGQTFKVRVPVRKNSPGIFEMGWRLYNLTFSYYFGQEAYRSGIEVGMPSQWLAKLYTEAFGRAPDQPGWSTHYADLRANLGTAALRESVIKNKIRGFFQSTEFANLYPNNAVGNEARVIALYRAVLNRDPEDGGFIWARDQLNAGTAFSDLVDIYLNTSEFASVLGVLFTGMPYAWRQGSQPDYVPSPHRQADASCAEIFDGGTGGQLQDALNRNTGRRLCLAQKAIVRVSNFLYMPENTTLATAGAATLRKEQYALFGRIIRSGNMAANQPIFQLDESGARIENVWIDGQATANTFLSSLDRGFVINRPNATIHECKVSDIAAGTTTVISEAATNATITDNVITCYPSLHFSPNFDRHSDGITVGGPTSTIRGNHIVDATDVGIVVFATANATAQSSLVENNIVLNAGNSAYAALAVEPFFTTNSGGVQTRSFAGTIIRGNTFWTGGDAHYDIGICVGSRPWWQSPFGTAFAHRGSGLLRVENNTTGTLNIRTNVGLAVNNFTNATVTGNSYNFVLANYTGMILASGVVQTNTMISPNTLQSGLTSVTNNALMDGLVHHNQ